MDAALFDTYSSYSDSSAPNTPEPRPIDMHFNYKSNLDVDVVRNIFVDQNEPHVEVHPPHDGTYWASPTSVLTNNFLQNNGSRGSLLQELYEEPQNANPDVYPDHTANNASDNWSFAHRQQQLPHGQQLSSRPHDYHIMRRNTFPTVRYDREDGLAVQQYPPFLPQQYQRSDSLGYSDQVPLSAENAPVQNENFMQPHPNYPEMRDSAANIKLEDSSSMGVPSHSFYRPSSSSGCAMTMPYMPAHSGLQVQHTDDAASKETQYLRRRCFNCHTTEPPSWRRSTLNPGKIVCNKCGLYERTHLRPRPLRFDELRAGNKQRKQSKGTVSPKTKTDSVKKEPREFGLVRRSSISSSSSSVHSGSGASEWDDNVSVYSTSSAPPTSFNSPSIQTFPLSRSSQSPPHDGGIRLPNAPLTDIASLQQQQQQHGLVSQPSTPSLNSASNSQSSPGYFSSPGSSASPSAPNTSAQAADYFRRATHETATAVADAWGDIALKDGPTNTLLTGPVPTPVAS